MCRAGVAERVRATIRRLNSQKIKSPAHGLPHCNGAERTVRLPQGHEDIPASAAWPSLGQVTQDGLAHFVLQRIALVPATFSALNVYCLLAPINVAQAQSRNLA